MPSRFLRGSRGDRVFQGATITALALLTLFLVGIFVSLLPYTNWHTFIATLFSSEILFAIRLSLITATLATIICIAIAVPTAYVISRSHFPGKDIVDTILDLPIVVSPVALGAALLVFFNNPVGVGIESRLIRFVFEVPGIVLAQVVVISALAIRLLKSTFDSFDPRYEQVGRTLGYSRAGVFLRVSLPLAQNGLIGSTILTWARAVGEFGATVTLAGATPFKTETLPVAIFLSLSRADVDKAIAAILVLVLIGMAALMAIRKLAPRGYHL